MYAVLYARETKLKDQFPDLHIVEAKKIADPSAKPNGWFILSDQAYLQAKESQTQNLKEFLEAKRIAKQGELEQRRLAEAAAKQKKIDDQINIDKIPALEQQVADIMARLDKLENP